jgi:hypothetical protein
MSCYTGFFNVRRGWKSLNTGTRFNSSLILDWNNWPIKIKSISNKHAFKSAVKNYLKITARNREYRMILAMIFTFYVYSHNIYIYVPIFYGNILSLVLNIIFSHFVLYLQVMDPIGNKPSGFMGYTRQSCTARRKPLTCRKSLTNCIT